MRRLPPRVIWEVAAAGAAVGFAASAGLAGTAVGLGASAGLAGVAGGEAHAATRVSVPTATPPPRKARRLIRRRPAAGGGSPDEAPRKYQGCNISPSFTPAGAGNLRLPAASAIVHPVVQDFNQCCGRNANNPACA